MVVEGVGTLVEEVERLGEEEGGGGGSRDVGGGS